MKILITGGNGYIAKSLINNLKFFDITTISRKDFDLTDPIASTQWFSDKLFDVVIHTAVVGGSRLKKDSDETIKQNLSMIMNLYHNKNHFKKLITFGSGAEIFQQNTPYGLSKRSISEIVNATDGWYNLRIFGVFDHNELDTRFIKGNILKYIKNQPMIIHNDKIMDFIYMQDLIELVDYYIKNDNLNKTINCSYDKKYTLKNITDFINTLDNHKVPVILENSNELEFYCGNGYEMNKLPIPQFGLLCGIINTFTELSKQ